MASISKSRFLCTSFKFLGSQFSANGREADPNGTKAFREMPDPTTYKSLRSWIGLAAYFSDWAHSTVSRVGQRSEERLR
jgi:hypothetical protein